jgi:hypothetical protein
MSALPVYPLPDLDGLPGRLRTCAAAAPMVTMTMDPAYSLRLARVIEAGRQVAAREAAVQAVLRDLEERATLREGRLKVLVREAEAVMVRMFVVAVLSGLTLGLCWRLVVVGLS